MKLKNPNNVASPTPIGVPTSLSMTVILNPRLERYAAVNQAEVPPPTIVISFTL